MESLDVMEKASVMGDRSFGDGAPRSLRILLAEDEAVLRRVIARNLSNHGHTVLESDTAEDTLRKVNEDVPDLILLDINLPDRSGWDVLRDLQRRGIEIPTVVVSAVRVGPARLAEFRPLAYLPKPFPLESLLRIVEEISAPNRPADPRGSAGLGQ